MDFPPPTYEQTVEAIAHCGISRASIKVTYQDYLQSDEVTIDDLGVISDQKLRCLRDAVHPSYVLTLVNGEQHQAFNAFCEREDRPRRKAEAREWARSKGMLARIPSFDREKGVVAFAHAIEDLCGIKQGQALVITGESNLAVRPSFVVGTSFEESAGALECLIQTIAASDAYEHGIGLVFIGNQAFVEPEEK